MKTQGPFGNKEGFVSAAQRKAVWASKADGGKGHPDNKKKKSKKEDTSVDEASCGYGSKKKTNEVSKDMMGRYLKKATPSAADGGRDSVMGSGKEKQGVKKVVNRITGTRTAVDKMTGKAKVPATEEKHVFRFSTKSKQGNHHHDSKDHKGAAAAIEKRTGEKVMSMTYRGTADSKPKPRLRSESFVGVKGSDGKAMDMPARPGRSSTSAGRHNNALHTLNSMVKKHEREHNNSDHLGHDDALKAIDHAGSKLNKHGADHHEFKSAMDKAKDASKKAMQMNNEGYSSYAQQKAVWASRADKKKGKKEANEPSQAVKDFLAKGGKIKKLPPAKAQGYHGKDDPGKDVAGVMDRPDTKAMGTRKKVKSMESKTFFDLRSQLDESMLGHSDAEKLNGGKSKDPNFKSPESHIDHHHRQSGGHNKSGGDQDRHRYNVAKKLGYDV